MVDSAPDSVRVAHHAAVAELLREPPGSATDRGATTFHVTVRGSCMEPALLDGQRVQVRRSRWALPGDVVAFERGADDPRLAVHRLLGARPSRTGWVYITQADNDQAPDPPFVARRLLGVAEVPVSLGRRARSLARLLPALARPLRARLGRARRSSLHVSPSAQR
ncbi:MAG: S24/S26 family peptidase [Myxococcales bacterium]|nr:S24/S26 family peptidase [Myxococcales bacterium]MCB9625994.1 S24/S26 family peptidase [Sandaracinaceae bacterium]